MIEQLYPYVIFLPKDRKQTVLRAIFGSKVPVDILRFALDQGISSKIFQKDLIIKLGYSNKTVIERLKMLTKLEVLEEHMEKSESSGRTVWLKYYLLSDLGRWFALLLVEEKTLPKEKKIIIVRDAFYSYVRWIKNLSMELGMDRRDLSKIFKDVMDNSD
jgi:hypothetical protein